MIIQISSGQGPAECELAVGKLYDALKEEYPDIEYLSGRKGKNKRCYTSIMFWTEADLSQLEGSVLWISKSAFRPNHKRKNWFVDVSIIQEVGQICRDADIRFERFHCGGKGGQNVNKVETGVRLTHLPTGVTVTSTTERSQYLNKKNAMEKLNAILDQMETHAYNKQIHDAWREHNRIVRGNPVRVYEGEAFTLTKNHAENE